MTADHSLEPGVSTAMHSPMLSHGCGRSWPNSGFTTRLDNALRVIAARRYPPRVLTLIKSCPSSVSVLSMLGFGLFKRRRPTATGDYVRRRRRKASWSFAIKGGTRRRKVMFEHERNSSRLRPRCETSNSHISTLLDC